MVTGFAQGITAAQAFVRIGVEDKVSAALTIVQGKINQFAANVSSIGASIQKVAIGGGIFGAGLFFGLKRATMESSRATEVNTAYAATFRELTGEANTFADTLATRFKRDVIDVKDIQRSFFGLFSGNGLDRKFALQAANIFSQLSYDFSSFFNQTEHEAAARLLSALSNSAEVVQRFGFNVRVESLEPALKKLGIRKTIAQASEAEKLIARVLVLLETSSQTQLNIFGDVERTTNEFANQARGLGSAYKILLRAIGQPLEKALAPVFGGLRIGVQSIADWVRINPQFVTQIALLTAGLVAGGTALVTLGFGIRLAAFSLSPLFAPLRLVVVSFLRLYDGVMLSGTGLFHFGRFLSGVLRTGLAAAVAPLNALYSGFTLLGRGVAFATSMMLPFPGVLRSIPFAAMLSSILSIGAAFLTSFRSVATGTAAAGLIMSSMGGAATATAATGTAMIRVGGIAVSQARNVDAFYRAFSTPPRALIGNALKAVQMPVRGFIAGPVAGVAAVNLWLKTLAKAPGQITTVLRDSSGAIIAVSNTMASSVTSSAVRSTSVIARLVSSLRAAVLSSFSLIQRALVPLMSMVARSVAGAFMAATMSAVSFASVVRTAVTAAFVSAIVSVSRFSAVAVLSIASITASLATSVAVGLAPFLANFALLSAVAVTVVGTFYVFRDEIAGVFNAMKDAISSWAASVSQSVGWFAERSTAAFRDIFEFSREQFGKMLMIGKETFRGISDAIEAGEFQLAFKVAVAGMKESFFTFTFGVVDRWGTLIASFMDGLISLKFGFQRYFTEILGISSLVFNQMKEQHQGAVDSISRGLITMAGKVGLVDNPEEVLRTLDEDIARREKGVGERIAAETARQLDALRKAESEAKSGIGTGVQAFRNKLGSAMLGAQRESVHLAEQAAAAKGKQFGQLPGPLQNIPGFVNGLPNALGGRTMREGAEKSLKGLEVRSSEGMQSFIDAFNGGMMSGVEEKIAKTNVLLGNIPAAVGDQFQKALDGVGVAEAPGFAPESFKNTWEQ